VDPLFDAITNRPLKNTELKNLQFQTAHRSVLKKSTSRDDGCSSKQDVDELMNLVLLITCDNKIHFKFQKVLSIFPIHIISRTNLDFHPLKNQQSIHQDLTVKSANLNDQSPIPDFPGGLEYNIRVLSPSDRD
jgi:hypothetical protein